jgi:hypothetical protein
METMEDHTEGHLYVQYRLDFEKNNNTLASASSVNDGKRTGFKFNYMRVNWRGKINKKTAYRFRLALDKAHDTVNEDGVLSNLNYAYLTYDIAPKNQVIVGKLYLYGGGREVWKGSSNSHGFSNASLGATFGTGFSYINEFSKGQKLRFLAVNGDDASNQTKIGTGLVYEAKLFNGVLKPMFSAHLLPISEQKSLSGSVSEKGRYKKQLSITTDIDTNYFHFSLGCHMINEGTNSPTNSGDDKKKSCYLWNQYKLTEKIQPILVGHAGNEYSNGIKSINQYAVKTGIHYYPDGRNTHHIHLVVDYTKTGNIGSNSTTENKIVLGLTNDFSITY